MSALFAELVAQGLVKQEQERARCIVRLRRSWWSDARGVHQRVDLGYVKRECTGYNILEEDATNVGADLVMPLIKNLDECKDGVYEVVTCNEKRDWESGYVEEYDYRLIPYANEKKGKT